MKKLQLTLQKTWIASREWIQENRKEAIAFGTILFVGAFLRLYRIAEYMTFLGDEGRDAVLVRRLLVNFDPILIGPGTSIGNMYLGPLYYYLIAPAMAVFGLSPVGSSVLIALIGIMTIGLVWLVGREWFGKYAGFIAALLYAISPVVIVYSRSSWNPNIMPFFALLCIYGIWRVWKFSEWKWLEVVGVSFAFSLQSHYLGLLLVPILGLFWLLSFVQVWKHKSQKLSALRHTLYAIILFAFLMSPLVIFDARHGWNNFSAMKLFFTHRQDTVSIKPWNALPEMVPLFEQMVTRLLVGMNTVYGKWVAIGLAGGGIWLLFHERKRFFNSPLFLLTVWLGVGLLGLALYKQNIYDHYFGFMFVVPFLILGGIMQSIVDIIRSKHLYNILIYYTLLILIVGLVILNLYEIPIKHPPQRQLQRTEAVAVKIAEEAGDKPFNLAVLAERNYEDAYQYFLEWWKKPVRDIEPLRYQETVAEQLFVVCELPPEKCDPTHSSKTEITTFGWSKIEGQWEVEGVQVYKLGHNPTGIGQ